MLTKPSQVFLLVKLRFNRNTELALYGILLQDNQKHTFKIQLSLKTKEKGFILSIMDLWYLVANLVIKKK